MKGIFGNRRRRRREVAEPQMMKTLKSSSWDQTVEKDADPTPSQACLLTPGYAPVDKPGVWSSGLGLFVSLGEEISCLNQID